VDVERVIEFILDQQARNEERFAETDARIARTQAQTQDQSSAIWALIAEIKAVRFRIDENMKSLSSPE
jgi:capsule polysaccharide export protein KpsE/RkpR